MSNYSLAACPSSMIKATLSFICSVMFVSSSIFLMSSHISSEVVLWLRTKTKQKLININEIILFFIIFNIHDDQQTFVYLCNNFRSSCSTRLRYLQNGHIEWIDCLFIEKANSLIYVWFVWTRRNPWVLNQDYITNLQWFLIVPYRQI